MLLARRHKLILYNRGNYWIEHKKGYIAAATGHYNEGVANFTHALDSMPFPQNHLTQSQLAARDYVSRECGQDKLNDRGFLIEKINQSKGIHNKNMQRAEICQDRAINLCDSHPSPILTSRLSSKKLIIYIYFNI